ncbi:glycoside hydrolase family 78 protein [Salinimicrobium sp. CAU 1759]
MTRSTSLSNTLKQLLFLLSFLLVSCAPPVREIKKGLQPSRLTTENLDNPIGIDVKVPRLSWISTSEERGVSQSAYRILVASSGELLEKDQGDLWDSGRIVSDESLYIPYEGKTLGSGDAVFWKVKLWDRQGEESDWSEPAQWSMGLLDPSDWKGEWIGLDLEMGADKLDTTFTRMSARYLRKEIELQKQIRTATAHIAGLGLFELYINGKKISEAVLAPALAEYPKRAYYMSFDVTEDLTQGRNALGVILGNGRYVGVRIDEIELYYDSSKLTHYGFPKMIAQLEVEYTDGSRETIVSDTSWKITADGPILANNAFDGEEYDANKEMPGWNATGFKDAAWLQAEKVAPGAGILSAQMIPPIEVTGEVEPVSISEVKQDTFILDMGQNMVGWVNLRVEGKKGDTVSMRFAERLNPDGSLYLDPIRTARVNDIYILKGEEEEVWEPRFTYHGFQYVEVVGYPGEPKLENFTGRVVHDALRLTGQFTTSNEMINQIYQNARWGIRGNYRSIPTDCPQRDERQAWLGDRATGSRGESYLFDNANFYTKWLQDIEDSQFDSGSLPDVAPTYWKVHTDNVTWPAAYIIIADMLHDQFGEDRGIHLHYHSMKKWMSYMREQYMKDFIIEKDNYGDWGVPPEAPGLIHTEDVSRKTSPGVLATSYYYHLLGIMEGFAEHLGKPVEAQEFSTLKQQVGQAFHDRFFDAEAKAYRNNTATTNVLALHFGLVPEEFRQQVFDNLVQVTMEDFNGHISVGLIGVQAIMRIFTDHGRPDIAYKLATNTTYPSWGYMVEQGATTVWELWNSDTADPFMNSWNHVMLLGDLLIWYYEDLAGIAPDPEAPAFKRIIMKPTLAGDLKFVKASHNSPFGMIKSEWELLNGDFHWNISIPANTTATVYVPADGREQVMENGVMAEKAEGITYLLEEENRVLYSLGAGDYSFLVRNSPSSRSDNQ